MHFTTLQEWLQWLENLQPREKQDFHLTTVTAIAKKLHVIPVNKPVITVTGTNGKGSCVAFCEAILQAQGYRVGAYYSPHVSVFNERIRFKNQLATDAQICEAFHIINQARENQRLSYFEFATLAALLIFQQEAVDVLVLEVGVGGRLDTVNIVDADIAVITSVDLDHTHWLGVTREEIGREKSGIFRAGQQAVCGDKDPPASIKQSATSIGTNLYCYQKEYDFSVEAKSWSWWNRTTRYDDLPLPKLPVANAAVALQILSVFALPVTISAIHTGLQKAWLPGRFQVVSQPVLQVFDVAHNPAAADFFAVQLRAQAIQGRTIAVVGMLKDKAITDTLYPLLPIVDEWYLASLPGMRGADAAHIAKSLSAICPAARIKLFPKVAKAYSAALAATNAADRIIIFGSFHTVGEVCPVRV